MSIPVIAIFDIGKTNKKLLLFNEQYEIVAENSIILEETVDEDGEFCENIVALKEWIESSVKEVFKNSNFDIKAINFSAYGASFVYVDKDGIPLTPLYNYLKKYPALLKHKFYSEYGGEEKIAVETASPALESLNSGLQVYRLNYQHPALFEKIAFALHLPQYLSYLFTSFPATDITSIGCHTLMWDYQKNQYHHWVIEEKIDKKLAPVLPSSTTAPVLINNKKISVGIGLHDSSAALIPYLLYFQEPFILISTGTWCISLNPFNETLLTKEALKQDCLCYMSYNNKPVKAARLFAGYEHEQTIKKLAEHFNKPLNFFTQVTFNKSFVNVEAIQASQDTIAVGIHPSAFSRRDLNSFSSYEEAYHCLIADIIQQQKFSTGLILNTTVTRIFVDGGFSKNKIYMTLLATAFSNIQVFAATLPQSSARGAALVMHQSWNKLAIPDELISVEKTLPIL
jgi:sugar (pentulose or hexulose) kinase